MDGLNSKAEAMKPIILKAGIPLAVSMAGLVFARFMARKGTSATASSSDDQINSPASYSEAASAWMDDDEDTGLIENSDTPDKIDHEEEMLRLKTRFQELQMREHELEMRFVRYRDFKEQESVLMELKSTLMLEKAYIEFFDREVSSMGAENKRLEDLVMIYLRVLEQIEGLRSENGLLRRKVKRLMRRTKKQSCVMKEKNMKIYARERELLRSLEESETVSNVVKNLEDEVKDLQATVHQLQEQKTELLSKLNSKTEIEYDEMAISLEDYKQLLDEYENLRRDQADQERELIYLRWSNACLRHELMRIRMNEEHGQEHRSPLEEIEFEEYGNVGNSGVENQTDDAPVLDDQGDHHVYSKRKRLLKKLKRLVEGCEKVKPKFDKRERNEMKCSDRHSVSDEVARDREQQLVLVRRSCSSA